MDKPLTIFVSSSIGEFRAQRRALKAAFKQWPFVAWVFEEETAHAEARDEGYLRRAAECDVFILILGERETSAVEKEFAMALAANRPVLAFVRNSDKARAWAKSMFDKYRCLDRFKYGVFNMRNLKPLVIEAVGDTILSRFRLTREETHQLTNATPRLMTAEREQLDMDYSLEVAWKYEFWRTHYAPLPARAPLPTATDQNVAALPPEFLPRSFSADSYPHLF